jgi:thiol-disulfide isomerase/thioredoxin
MSDGTIPTRRRFLAASAALASLALSGVTPAFGSDWTRVRRPNIPAPRWDISEWINGDGGNIDTLKGRVIVIDFFQLWCPGCNRFSGPLMAYWQKKYAAEIKSGRMLLVKIHTVFEGHGFQTVRRLKRYIKDKHITMPVGVDRHVDGRRLPETMRRYKTRGTPEMAIIDADGIIRFQKFGFFQPATVEPLIERLLAQARA